MMNKRGIQSFNYLHWIVRIIYLIIVVITVVMLIGIYATSIVSTEEMEANIFIQRLLYSPNGVSYYDADIGRVYPGLIDPSKLKGDLLNRSVYYGEENRYVAAKLVLFDNSESVMEAVNKYLADLKAKKTTSDDMPKYFKMLVPIAGPLYYNKLWFDRWWPRAQTEAGGSGGVKKFERKFAVTYLAGKDVVKKGELWITVVIPNA